MRNLVRLLYGGLAFATVGAGIAGYLYLRRGDNPPPKEPTPIILETATPMPSQTPEPTLTYTPEPTDTATPELTDTPVLVSTYPPTPEITQVIDTPTAVIEPTDTPTLEPSPTSTYTPTPELPEWMVNPPVTVDCRTCIPENPPEGTRKDQLGFYKGYYEQVARDAYRKVAEAFGMVPTRQDGSLVGFDIAIDDRREYFGLNNGEGSFPYGIIGFRTTLPHEMVHDFSRHLIGDTGQEWWEEGVAEYISRGGDENYRLMKDWLDAIENDPTFWERRPDFGARSKGYSWFAYLTREGVLDEQINRIAIHNLIKMRPEPYWGNQRWTSYEDIESAYLQAGVPKSTLGTVYTLLRLEESLGN